MALAERPDVAPRGQPAPGVCIRMVLVGRIGRPAAAGERAGPVADLDVAGQRGAGEPSASRRIEPCQDSVPPGVLGGDIRHHRSPGAGGGGSGGELTQNLGRDMELDDPTPAGTPPRHRPTWSAAGETGEDQVALGVGDGETPLSPAPLISDQAARYVGQHRAEPGYLAASFIQPEEGGQPDPHLDPGSRRVSTTSPLRPAN